VGYVMLSLQPTPALREEARHAADTALDLQPDLETMRHKLARLNFLGHNPII
jgi:hypothetical protein